MTYGLPFVTPKGASALFWGSWDVAIDLTSLGDKTIEATGADTLGAFDVVVGGNAVSAGNPVSATRSRTLTVFGASEPRRPRRTVGARQEVC